MGSARNVARRAFTLIEMLVVITIMALLVALLMPVLSGARETAHRAMCASNLRQWGVMAINYAESNRGDFPGGTAWGANDIFEDAYYNAETDPTNPPAWVGYKTQWAMMDYGFSIPVTRCPSRKQPREPFGWWYDNFPGYWFATDYFHFFGRASRKPNDPTDPFNFMLTGWTVGPLYADWNFGWKTRAPIPNQRWPRSLRTVMAYDRTWTPINPGYYYDQGDNVTGFDNQSNHLAGHGEGTPKWAAGANYLLLDASVTWEKLDDGNVYLYGLRNGVGPGMKDYYRNFVVGTKLRHP
jgi:prepilin-type N-terminal cleavage/methylation domain-containing protein